MLKIFALAFIGQFRMVSNTIVKNSKQLAA